MWCSHRVIIRHHYIFERTSKLRALYGARSRAHTRSHPLVAGAGASSFQCKTKWKANVNKMQDRVRRLHSAVDGKEDFRFGHFTLTIPNYAAQSVWTATTTQSSWINDKHRVRRGNSQPPPLLRLPATSRQSAACLTTVWAASRRKRSPIFSRNPFATCSRFRYSRLYRRHQNWLNNLQNFLLENQCQYLPIVYT